ncbi:MAG: hypothetical protein JNK30_17225 [Phenylobacterium sp.]|uniref:hypothetical protein n=1 Tax=Phenylobacterium sp. TaxID=1871053 RepID=UPI001A5DF995|nr:hypothetical protein [Phenylobacterium sp.]MBL8773126.1 hypothetical protein [Phenylobacterium sp.]
MNRPDPSRAAGRRRSRKADFGIRGGLAFAIIASPRVNAPAWFGLAAAVPALLLAAAAAMTQAGLPRAAGLYAALLLAPAVLLALGALERRRVAPTPAETRDEDLARALVLTVGQASGLLFVVMLGARFSGEAIAVGLAMAGMPLALSLARNLWRRAVKPLNERLAATQVSVRRNWTLEWLQAEALRSPPREPASVTVLNPRRAPPVTLRVMPAAVDEGWMRYGERAAREPAAEEAA